MNYSDNKRGLVYVAAPLFSQAERKFNEHIARHISATWNVYLPQSDCGLMSEMLANGVVPREASKAVFSADVKALDDCDVLLAILDGRAVDEGVAFELGYAFAHRKTCIALQTDARRMLATGNNPMIEHAVSQIFTTDAALFRWMAAIGDDSTNVLVPKADISVDSRL